MFLVNSRLGQFTAAPSGFTRKALHPTGASLLPKLRDDFAEFLNDGYLDHLSILYLRTCVGFGTGTHFLAARLFLGAWRQGLAGQRPAGIAPQVMRPRIYRATPTCLTQDDHRLSSLSLPRPPISQMTTTWYRNINLLSIDYAFRPRLRSRLTLSRRTLLRKPWDVGGGDSHSSLVTHAGILTSHGSTAGSRRRFTAEGTLSYRVYRSTHPQLRGMA